MNCSVNWARYTCTLDPLLPSCSQVVFTGIRYCCNFDTVSVVRQILYMICYADSYLHPETGIWHQPVCQFELFEMEQTTVSTFLDRPIYCSFSFLSYTAYTPATVGRAFCWLETGCSGAAEMEVTSLVDAVAGFGC